jgi:hypothetical protein
MFDFLDKLDNELKDMASKKPKKDRAIKNMEKKQSPKPTSAPKKTERVSE